MNAVFRRQRLTSSQARTVADRRYDDAAALRDTRRSKHANGAIYLGGIALELLLKALLIEKHPWLGQPFGDPSKRTKSERELFDLCYVHHDLEELLNELPELRGRLAAVQGGRHSRTPLLVNIKKLCAEWTIHIRYSTQQATIQAANDHLERLKEIKRWLSAT